MSGKFKWTAKLTIAYDGTDYVGWQVQTNGVSVQQELEAGWSQVTGETIRIMASGRTDAGVHAWGQVCSCQTETGLSPGTLCRALNAQTPRDICVTRVEQAPDGFHAIRDATEKTYRYLIQHGRLQSPFALRSAWYIPRPLDIGAMREMASHLVGRHDFASLQAQGSPRLTTVREIRRLELAESRAGAFQFVKITLTADGFLYNMARNIVGCLVEAGEGRKPPDWILEVLAARDRSAAAMTAPALGLTLVDVKYGHA